jgi:hypothetical protein
MLFVFHLRWDTGNWDITDWCRTAREIEYEFKDPWFFFHCLIIYLDLDLSFYFSISSFTTWTWEVRFLLSFFFLYLQIQWLMFCSIKDVWRRPMRKVVLIGTTSVPEIGRFWVLACSVMGISQNYSWLWIILFDHVIFNQQRKILQIAISKSSKIHQVESFHMHVYYYSLPILIMARVQHAMQKCKHPSIPRFALAARDRYSCGASPAPYPA